MTEKTPELTIKVQRYNPDKDQSPHLESYQVPLRPGLTILEALFYIKEKLNGSLAFRTSCRMGICGTCGVLVNGFPHLACHTQVAEFISRELIIRPLANFPLVKDLVVDMEELFAKHRSLHPYLIGPRPESAAGELEANKQTPEELLAYLQFAYCLECGLCLAACPTFGSARDFVGPQALAQAYRYCADSRDAASRERLELVSTKNGLWRCHLAGSCSKACPKGVDPALAIQLLRREATKTALGLKPAKPT